MNLKCIAFKILHNTNAGVLTEHNGIAAVAGINGNETHYTPIQSSGTQNIINIASTSNVNVTGVWIFQLDGDDSTSIGMQRIFQTIISPYYN